MACTPKKVRRNGGCCICDARLEGDARPCRYNCCIEFRCPVCNGKLGGWGLIGCKCDGGPRWARHRAMEARGHWDLKLDRWVPGSAAVKPSLPKFKRDLAAFR